MDGPPIDDGAVAVDDERISAVGRFAEVQAASGGENNRLRRSGPAAGLINAHCHLDFTALRGAIAPQRSFADWIRQINAKRRELTDRRFPRLDHGWICGSAALGHNDDGEYRVARRNSSAAFRRRRCGSGGFSELIDVRRDASPEELVETRDVAGPSRASVSA